MKKRIFLLVLVGIFLVGCAGARKKTPTTINIPPGGVAALSSIPSPRAGLTLVINRNERVSARCLLYEGKRSKRDIIGIGLDGNPVLNDNPLLIFDVQNAVMKDFWSFKALILQPYSEYTLFVIWSKNITGSVVDFDKVRIRTSGNPFRRSHIDDLGRKVFADNIVRLPRVRVRGMSRLRINKTLYLGDWIKGLIGLP